MEPSDVRTKLLATASLLLIVFGVVLFQKKTETVAAIRRARRKKKEFGNVNIGGKSYSIFINIRYDSNTKYNM